MFLMLAILYPNDRLSGFGVGLSCKIWPWQKVAPRTIFCRKKWPPRPILAAKSGPPLQNLAHPPNCSLLTLMHLSMISPIPPTGWGNCPLTSDLSPSMGHYSSGLSPTIPPPPPLGDFFYSEWCFFYMYR